MPTRDEMNRRIAEALGWRWHQYSDGTVFVVNPSGRSKVHDLCDERELAITAHAADELVRLGKIEGWTLESTGAYGPNATVFHPGDDFARLIEEGDSHAERLATALYRALGGE